MKILNSPLNIETMGASDNFAHTKVFNDRVYYTTISADNKGVSVASTDINGNDKRHEIPDGIYIKTKINVYGGICFCPTDFGVVFSNSKDGELYLVNNEGLKQLTSSQQYNYGDISYNNNLILFVAEERNGHFPKQHIGQIDLNTNEYNIIDQGADFYHAPQSDTDKTIWLEWNLPHMPWDNSAVIMLENNNKTILSDGIGHFQPLLNNGNVYYAKDTGEYFNIFKNSQNIFKTDIDFYMPLWVYGMTTYTVINDTVIACGTENGDWVIGKLSNDGFNKIKTDYVYFDGLTGNDNTVSFVGRKSNKPSEVVIMNNDKKTIIDCGKDLPINDDYISAPKKVNFKNETNDTIYAYYYAPKNPEYDNTIPPLIVKSHSGPTGQATTEYNPKIQFWTSRGFAVLDVNYSGSTGFGSHYRNRLNGRWGEIDVKELELGATYCVENGLADKDKLIVSGSSAGGYSVLCALAFGNTFTAGTSVYGIGDLSSLAEETHKFEANYFDVLIAPYQTSKDIYKYRSPINSANNIQAPVLFLQGLDDVVVPPNQSELMYSALKQNGVKTALINYVGEGHGFRNSQTKSHALTAELQFYDHIFNGKETNYTINEVNEFDFN